MEDGYVFFVVFIIVYILLIAWISSRTNVPSFIVLLLGMFPRVGPLLATVMLLCAIANVDVGSKVFDRRPRTQARQTLPTMSTQYTRAGARTPTYVQANPISDRAYLFSPPP